MTTILAGALLVLWLAALWWFVRRDRADYSAFKLLEVTKYRQRRCRIWVLKSFLLFSVGSTLCLLVLGRTGAISSLPMEFRELSARAGSLLPASKLPGPEFLIGFGSALLVGVVGGALIMTRMKTAKPLTLGDIEPLMPRNRAETAHTAVLALNAGFSEELFFRLLLPLLATLVLRNALAAFAIAAVIFGLVHIYQGIVGVLATTVLGAALTVLYLWTGSLWIAMAVHASFDLLGLVVRPTFTRLLTKR
jgi:membrane protease YdiL (CAAX protease family)